MVSPSVPISGYRDGFGNWCTRFLAPTGRMLISADAVVRDIGRPDPVVSDARQVKVEELPEEVLVFLLSSRFCDSDRLLDLAWTLFGATEPGWERVQAICDFAHQHITFGYEHARVTRTASEAYQESCGVCRDYAHLAVAFCRALNIPARYCTGYLSEVGTPPPHPLGDLRHGSRLTWTVSGIRLMRGTMFPASVGSLWHVGGTQRMSLSQPRSAPTRFRVFASGRM